MNCGHNDEEFILTPELTHYGKSVCGTCGGFVRWHKKPETIALLSANAAKLAFLREQKLNDWESGFVLTLEKSGRPSPKQQAKLDEVAIQYGYTT